MSDFADIPLTAEEEAAERAAGEQWEREHWKFILGCKIGITAWIVTVGSGLGYLSASSFAPAGPGWMRWVFAAVLAWLFFDFAWCPWAREAS